MRDVVVMGGGLSGLAAAWELEQCGVDYTLIEVKRRLGGHLNSVVRDGFIMDEGAFALADTLDANWLATLGLGDALYTLQDDAQRVVAFKEGTGSLIDAIERRMAAPRLMRMAVSSIGELENGRYSICMENGLMFDARALVIALPAKWAERVFYGYITPLTETLLGYSYDTIQRVSLGFRTQDLPATLPTPWTMAHVYKFRTTHPARVPEGHTMLQFGLRLAPEKASAPQDVIRLLCETFNLPQPVAQHIGYWPESDPISCFDDAHETWVNEIRAQLPAGIALIGNDYSLKPPRSQGITDLSVQITQGQQAAQQVLASL